MTSPALPPDREPKSTTRRTTLSIALLAAALLGACGGGGKASGGDSYAKGTRVQEQCCENLEGAGRDSCLQKIVRVEDPQVASSPVNQEQYACIVDNFVCDSDVGHATKESAQKQMDCIQALPQ